LGRETLDTSKASSSANEGSRNVPTLEAVVFSCKLKKTNDLKIIKRHGVKDDADLVVIDMTEHMKRDPDEEHLDKDQTGLVEAFRQKFSQDPGMQTALAEATEHYRLKGAQCITLFACNKGKHCSVSAAELFAEKHGLVVRHLDVAEHLSVAE